LLTKFVTCQFWDSLYLTQFAAGISKTILSATILSKGVWLTYPSSVQIQTDITTAENDQFSRSPEHIYP